VDGSKILGLGHIFQEIQLAESLKDTQDAEIFFFSIRDSDVELLSNNMELSNWEFLPYSCNAIESIKLFHDFCRINDLDLAIFDITDQYPNLRRNPYYFQLINEMKSDGIRTLGIEYISTQEYNVDALINASIIKKWQKYLWNRNVSYYLGPKYFILSSKYKELHSVERIINDKITKIFLCLGGSDKNNVTSKIVNYLINLDSSVKIDVVLGPNHIFLKEFTNSLLDSNPNIRVHDVSWKIWNFMIECDLAITSAGRIPYELAATGTPSICVPLVEHQELTANAFQAKGTTIKLSSSFSEKEFQNAIKKVMEDKELRIKMSLRGKKIVDGRGLERISKIISSLLKEKSEK
jgi:spore coat polysaccharide biosynthesis predicted glycosyltransferase SpsG